MNPRPDLRPHIINNSYACPEHEECSKTAFNAAVKVLRASGILMIASAGNSGPKCGTINAPPAIEPLVFTVGATDANDKLASFSARGPAIYAGGQILRKPAVVAPGVQILGAFMTSGYKRISGTSMAAPLVTGAAALISKRCRTSRMHNNLLVSSCPCLERSIERVERLLEESAVKMYPSSELKSKDGAYCGSDTEASVPNNYYGHGRIDVLKAVQQCREMCAELAHKYPRQRPGLEQAVPEEAVMPEPNIFESSAVGDNDESMRILADDAERKSALKVAEGATSTASALYIIKK